MTEEERLQAAFPSLKPRKPSDNESKHKELQVTNKKLSKPNVSVIIQKPHNTSHDALAGGKRKKKTRKTRKTRKHRKKRKTRKTRNRKR